MRSDDGGRYGALAILVLAMGLWGCSDCSLEVATKSVPDGAVGVNYFTELDSDCGGDFWFLQTGQIPPGIGLQDNGDLEGLPSLPGTYTFVVGVFDFHSEETAYRGLAITIDPLP